MEMLRLPGSGAGLIAIVLVEVALLAGEAESCVVRVTWNVPVLE